MKKIYNYSSTCFISENDSVQIHGQSFKYYIWIDKMDVCFNKSMAVYR